ncbi:TonB-dependent receptor [Parahaliea mediterranea]|uniref:TonB-dependent receptor n=1 Tax=Parahaliea mediterranea TaxID=651086 RepID=A0A939DFZ9_9GAMM|nr:TonB-dependent receptor [Parahaliea mediterranea]MBN7797509.1 TonB-dependent receptor [Parahaliea mediterranea]
MNKTNPPCHRKKLNTVIGLLLGGSSLVAQAAWSAAIEEVVVTAQKRAQSSRDVGIAMTAFQGDSLRESLIFSSTDIASQTPGLDIVGVEGTNVPTFTMRGVGLNEPNVNASSSVAIYMDEVYLSSPALANFALYDLERVEVLKGPQGTLYGRNTTGGAVKFVTRKPTEEFESYLTVTGGRWSQLDIEGSISGPLSESTQGRLTFLRKSRDGYVDNTNPGYRDQGEIDLWSLRGQLQFQPAEGWDINLLVHSSKDKSDPSLSQAMTVGTFDPNPVGQIDIGFGPQNVYTTCVPNGDSRAWQEGGAYDGCQMSQNLVPLNQQQAQDAGTAVGEMYTGVYGKPFQRGDTIRPRRDNEFLGLALTASWDMEFATFSSITAYNALDLNTPQQDLDGGPLEAWTSEERHDLSSFSQEFRLVSEPGQLVDWVAGITYSDDRIEGNPWRVFNARDLQFQVGLGPEQFTFLPFNTVTWVAWEENIAAAAAYGHTAWHLTDKLDLQIGVRYTHEERDFEKTVFDENPNGGSLLGGGYLLAGVDGSVPFADEDTWNDISGKVGLDYRLNDDWLLYVAYSKGFKSGGFSGGFQTRPEEAAGFDEEEVYSAELGFKASLLESSLILEAAVFDYDYRDIQLFTIDVVDGVSVSRLDNAGDAEVTGLEFQAHWRPASGLDVKAGGAWLDTTIPEYRSGQPIYGDQLPNSPEYTFNLQTRYEWNMTGGVIANVNVLGNWRDDTYLSGRNEPLSLSKSYWLWNASTGVSWGERQQNDLTVWVRNLEDEQYIVSYLDLNIYGLTSLNFGTPRTFGVSYTYRWD